MKISTLICAYFFYPMEYIFIVGDKMRRIDYKRKIERDLIKARGHQKVMLNIVYTELFAPDERTEERWKDEP